MVLQAMLQRLYRAVMRGPGLNARPHSSRQRIDLMDLATLQDQDPSTTCLSSLLEVADWTITTRTNPIAVSPEETEAWQKQKAVVQKLHRIASDAREYANDHGESALALGFPLLSLPPGSIQGNAARVLAPLALVPIRLSLESKIQPKVTLSTTGQGEDLLQPNPSLLAFIEHVTGETLDIEGAVAADGPPWEELEGLLQLVRNALGDLPLDSFDSITPLDSVPHTDKLPKEPSLLPGAVLGLFPTRNLELLRDTQWMIEHQATLTHPVVSFLDPRATAPPEPPSKPTEMVDHPLTPDEPATEQLITAADPCQRVAVQLARTSPVLVVHGPPGTGKSQTIANIIGDHLARGERVLFVCEKRTALDVVKHRLDALDLGHLCGVIHDPVSDRRDFYLGLRKRLENLANEPLAANPARSLNQANKTLTETRQGLQESYENLHLPNDDAPSFHEAVGTWLMLTNEVQTRHGDKTPTLHGHFVPEDLDTHRIAIEETLSRAERLRWPRNPWRQHPPGPLQSILSRPGKAWKERLTDLMRKSEAVDASLSEAPIFPDELRLSFEQFPLLAENLQAIHDQLLDLLGAADDDLLKAFGEATSETLQGWADQAKRMHGDAATLTDSPLSEEWLITAKQDHLTLSSVNERIVSIRAWREASGVSRLFRFLKASAAKEALAPLGLTLSEASADQALTFYLGLQRRITLTGAMPLSEAPTGWLGDDALSRHWHTRLRLTETFQRLERGQLAHSWKSIVNEACQKGGRALAELLPKLSAASDRLQAAHAWSDGLEEDGLFSEQCQQAWAERALSGDAFHPKLKALASRSQDLEDAARVEYTLTEELPVPLSKAVRAVAEHGSGHDDGLPLLACHAQAEAIRERIQDFPALQAMDGDRVQAAFNTLTELTLKKQEAVRRVAIYRWQKHQRALLLASTGSRLGAAGSALRQRLFVKGAKALKLRQMIEAGAEEPAGDPLFDMCPVWMAGPSTVAQILPRAPLFDTVIFDEASQCRLEEALPVLLRGKRVVIAGDPKQLPPTRFFEAAITDSEDFSANTAEELFEQRQAETEDLLSAALNLSVDEAYLDVHYRSQHDSLIQFSNQAFYQNRLQAVPAHPSQGASDLPLDLRRIDGTYEDRTNRKEAEEAVTVVDTLLAQKDPPSIGIACFNLPQHDLIKDLLEERAMDDQKFANRYATALSLIRDDAYEGLFVKNLENVQGDERDVMIISTGFGPNAEGQFKRHFGILNRAGGGRRLNVLITRARQQVIILTSIPRREYVSLPPIKGDAEPNGRYYLYAYLQFAATLGKQWREHADAATESRLGQAEQASCILGETRTPSPLAHAVGESLLVHHGIGSFIHWGNEGFRIDAALRSTDDPNRVTKGVLTDFTRYRRTPDPLAWDLFRTQIFQSQGWDLQRLWSPALFRRHEDCLAKLAQSHITALQQP